MTIWNLCVRNKFLKEMERIESINCGEVKITTRKYKWKKNNNGKEAAKIPLINYSPYNFFFRPWNLRKINLKLLYIYYIYKNKIAKIDEERNDDSEGCMKADEGKLKKEEEIKVLGKIK